MPALLAMVLAPMFTLGMLALAAQTNDLDCTILGTPEDDVLVGTDGDDVICGLGGDDILRGGAGNDHLVGGPGDDELIAGPGNDLLAGEDGNDRALGGAGVDEIRGGNGGDQLVGGAGVDLLFGERGNDDLAGGSGNDEIFGGSGNDFIRGGAGNDVLHGGVGGDILRGGIGQDLLRGGVDVDVCFDTFEETEALNCEFGRGGEEDTVAVRSQQWENAGDDEIAYSLTIVPVCDGPEECVVDVSGEIVVSRGEQAEAGDGVPAFAPKELFALSADAVDDERSVEFDERTGLPMVVEADGGAVVRVEDVEFRDAVRSRYEQALEAWSKVGMTEYTYVVERVCFCPLTAATRVSVTTEARPATERINPSRSSFASSARRNLVGDGSDEAAELEVIAAVGSVATGVDQPEAIWSHGVVGLDEHLALVGEALTGGYLSVDAEFHPETGAPKLIELDPGHGLLDAITIEIDEVVVTAGALIEPEVDVIGVSLSAPAGPLVIVDVKGIEVNALIADDVAAMIEAAAVDGISLSGAGYRSTDRQVELRRQNCGSSNWDIYQRSASSCSPPTAIPGTSQHETGLAIDLRNADNLIRSRSDPAFVWLAEHAGHYGLFNLPSEPWHWSTTGH